ncbi:MAG: hypothetical protein ACLQGP_25965 [Isosphaeraceae bacterium]
MTEARTDLPKALPADGPPKPAEARPPSHRGRKWLAWMGLAAGLAVGGYYLRPAVEKYNAPAAAEEPTHDGDPASTGEAVTP